MQTLREGLDPFMYTIENGEHICCTSDDESEQQRYKFLILTNGTSAVCVLRYLENSVVKDPRAAEA